MMYCVTSTTGLMDRTPARRRRSRIQTGVVARLLTPWMTQPTNVGQAAGASKYTATESREGSAPPYPTAPAAAPPDEPTAPDRAEAPAKEEPPAPAATAAELERVPGP